MLAWIWCRLANRRLRNVSQMNPRDPTRPDPNLTSYQGLTFRLVGSIIWRFALNFPLYVVNQLAWILVHRDRALFPHAAKLWKWAPFCAPSKNQAVECCRCFFWLPSNFNIGVYSRGHLRPKYGWQNWTMLSHKELNSLWLTLAIFFDPKHFVVEKRVRKSMISSRPNRQYTSVKTYCTTGRAFIMNRVWNPSQKYVWSLRSNVGTSI